MAYLIWSSRCLSLSIERVQISSTLERGVIRRGAKLHTTSSVIHRRKFMRVQPCGEPRQQRSKERRTVAEHTRNRLDDVGSCENRLDAVLRSGNSATHRERGAYLAVQSRYPVQPKQKLGTAREPRRAGFVQRVHIDIALKKPVEHDEAVDLRGVQSRGDVGECGEERRELHAYRNAQRSF